MRGIFIALYGINNIGKSTQARLLTQRLLASGVRVEYVKFPIYDIAPTGTKLNEILRGQKEKSMLQGMIDFFPGTSVPRPGRKPKNQLFSYRPIAQKSLKQTVTEHELQMWYSLNRYQYDPIIQKKLESGISILAEDYTGTGLAWGGAKGADAKWLAEVNKYLMKPDIEILMDGERFTTGREARHLHESNDRLIDRARKQFLLLARKENWRVVPANRALHEVNDDLWDIIKPLCRRRRDMAEPWMPTPVPTVPPSLIPAQLPLPS